MHKNTMERLPATPESRTIGRDDNRKRKWQSDITPKYTVGGIVYSDNRQCGSHKGWNEAGIQRFNALCFFVGEDCRKHPAVVPVLVGEWKIMLQTTKKRKKIVAVGNSTEAYYELWDDTLVPESANPTNHASSDNASITSTNNDCANAV